MRQPEEARGSGKPTADFHAAGLGIAAGLRFFGFLGSARSSATPRTAGASRTARSTALGQLGVHLRITRCVVKADTRPCGPRPRPLDHIGQRFVGTGGKVCLARGKKNITTPSSTRTLATSFIHCGGTGAMRYHLRARVQRPCRALGDHATTVDDQRDQRKQKPGRSVLGYRRRNCFEGTSLKLRKMGWEIKGKPPLPESAMSRFSAPRDPAPLLEGPANGVVRAICGFWLCLADLAPRVRLRRAAP